MSPDVSPLEDDYCDWVKLYDIRVTWKIQYSYINALITKKHKAIAPIQLYLVRSFLYSLTYCIKEVIKGNILWRLNEKSAGLWGRYSLKQANPLQFFAIHWSNCVCFIYFYIFDLLYQRGYQRQYFWTLILKVLVYEAATSWNRRIPCKILKFLIRLHSFFILIYFLLNVSKRLSKVRYFGD